MGHIGQSTGTEVKDQTLREDKEESEGHTEKKKGARDTMGQKFCRTIKGLR